VGASATLTAAFGADLTEPPTLHGIACRVDGRVTQQKGDDEVTTRG